MALRGPTDLVHWLAGYDLAGAGAITDITPSVEAATQDTTPLGPKGAIHHETPLGRIMYSFTEKGYLADRQESLRRLFAENATPPPWPSIVGQVGGHIGANVNLATDLRVKSHLIIPDVEGISQVDMMYYLHQDGELFQDAILIANGLVSGITNGPAPGVSYRHTHGSATNGGATICIMVDADTIKWRGFPDLAIQLRQFNGVNWTNLGNAIDLERDGGSIKSVFEIAAGQTIQSVLALQWLFSGVRDAFQASADFNAGVIEISVDGGTGLERIESGDILDIGGVDHTVKSASSNAVGEWDIILITPLAANLADNAIITLTGSNTELRYAACIERR